MKIIWFLCAITIPFSYAIYNSPDLDDFGTGIMYSCIALFGFMFGCFAGKEAGWDKAQEELFAARNYDKYIASPYWEIRKQTYFEVHKKECAYCKSSESIELHHRIRRNPGREKDRDLLPLCHRCHVKIHPEIENRNDYLAANEPLATEPK